MLVGFGEAGGVPPSYAIITDTYPPGKRAAALGIFNLGPAIGAAHRRRVRRGDRRAVRLAHAVHHHRRRSASSPRCWCGSFLREPERGATDQVRYARR